jgi:hypothetical protein
VLENIEVSRARPLSEQLLNEHTVPRRPVSCLFGVIAEVVVANEALHLPPTGLILSLLRSAAPTPRVSSGKARS